LVELIQADRPFIEPDQGTYYTPGPQGYIDYA
jgi:hypothetical protein